MYYPAFLPTSVAYQIQHPELFFVLLEDVLGQLGNVSILIVMLSHLGKLKPAVLFFHLQPVVAKPQRMSISE